MSNPFESLEQRLCNIEALLQSFVSEQTKLPEDDDILTIEQAAPLLKLSVSRLYSSKNKYPFYKPHGRVLFSRKELEEFMKSKKHKTVEQRFSTPRKKKS